MLITFLHGVFVLMVGYFWNEYRLYPWKFELISLILLVAFSVILAFSMLTVR